MSEGLIPDPNKLFQLLGTDDKKPVDPDSIFNKPLQQSPREESQEFIGKGGTSLEGEKRGITIEELLQKPDFLEAMRFVGELVKKKDYVEAMKSVGRINALLATTDIDPSSFEDKVIILFTNPDGKKVFLKPSIAGRTASLGKATLELWSNDPRQRGLLTVASELTADSSSFSYMVSNQFAREKRDIQAARAADPVRQSWLKNGGQHEGSPDSSDYSTKQFNEDQRGRLTRLNRVLTLFEDTFKGNPQGLDRDGLMMDIKNLVMELESEGKKVKAQRIEGSTGGGVTFEAGNKNQIDYIVLPNSDGKTESIVLQLHPDSDLYKVRNDLFGSQLFKLPQPE